MSTEDMLLTPADKEAHEKANELQAGGQWDQQKPRVGTPGV